MTEIESALREMSSGERSLASIGGLPEVLRHRDTLIVSPYFGDAVEALTNEWAALTSLDDAYRFVCDGIRRNADRLALGHAIAVIAETPPPDLKRIVMALDARTRDEHSGEILRLEAATGLTRLALGDPTWQSFAISALQVLDDVEESYPAQMLCKLASVCWDRFHDAACIALLERRSPNLAQASYERGMIGISMALDAADLGSIADGLSSASSWLKRAIDDAEDARDAHVYLLLTTVLAHVARSEPAPRELAEELRKEAVVRYLWDAPHPGAEWLFPPREAELEWIPLVDALVRISDEVRKPSWLDAAAVLTDVLRLYSSVRSVRFSIRGVDRVVRPAIEAAFVRERGLLAHLDMWTDRAEPTEFSPSDVRTLKNNIEIRLEREEPKEKR